MNEVLAVLQQIFRQVFGDEEIILRDSTTADDINGFDSMMMIQLMIAVERRFDIKFAAAEFGMLTADGQNIGTMAALIEKKRLARRDHTQARQRPS